MLTLARLLLTLPVSNGKLERVFSTMKNTKFDKRSSMSNELLDDLLVINVDKMNIKAIVQTYGRDPRQDAPIKQQGRFMKKRKKSKAQVAPASTLIQVTVCTVTVIS